MHLLNLLAQAPARSNVCSTLREKNVPIPRKTCRGVLLELGRLCQKIAIVGILDDTFCIRGRGECFVAHDLGQKFPTVLCIVVIANLVCDFLTNYLCEQKALLIKSRSGGLLWIKFAFVRREWRLAHCVLAFLFQGLLCRTRFISCLTIEFNYLA